MLWQVDIFPGEGQPDRTGEHLAAQASQLGLGENLRVAAARGYLLEGELTAGDVQRLARELLVDSIVERATVAPVGDANLSQPPVGYSRLVYVLPKPGVMDPVAQSTQAAIADFGLAASAVRTFRKYWLSEMPSDRLTALATKLLANDAIEQYVVGPLALERLAVGSPYEFKLIRVPLAGLDDVALERLSRERRCKPSATISKSWAAIRPTWSWSRWRRPGASIAATRRCAAASPIAMKMARGSSTTC
jgi:phosphoribosylformylglycinamidine (FGAM) synthase PurS component